MAPSAPLPALLLPRAQGKAGMGARDAAQPAARCDLTHPDPNPPPQAGEGAVIPAANTRFAPRLRAGGRATHREPPLCSFPRARGKAGMGANGAAPPAARCDLTPPHPNPPPQAGRARYHPPRTPALPLRGGAELPTASARFAPSPARGGRPGWGRAEPCILLCDATWRAPAPTLSAGGGREQHAWRGKREDATRPARNSCPRPPICTSLWRPSSGSHPCA